MKYLLSLVILLLFVGCNGCAATRNIGVHPYKNTMHSTVRIEVWCGQFPVSMGSGVAIRPNRILTAAHVMEPDKTPCIPGLQYRVIRWDKETFVGVAVKRDVGGQDLTIVETAAVFEPATIGPEPKEGDVICAYAWDGPDGLSLGGMRWFYGPAVKCDIVTYVTDDIWVSGMHGVHGNSGGGVWNSRGQVVGIITRASMDPNFDFWTSGPVIGNLLANLFGSTP